MRQAIICIIQGRFDTRQCPGAEGEGFIRLVSITLKAHYTQFKDISGIHGWTMENVAAGTNLGIYHWTIKQSCSAGDGTHWTHVPRCVQSHVKTQLTSWQRPPLCFHLPFSAAVPAYPVWGLVLWLGTALPRLRLPHSRRFHWTGPLYCFPNVERANAEARAPRAGRDLRVQIMVKWEVSLWRRGRLAQQHVFGTTFPLSVQRLTCPPSPPPGLSWVCARSQPHQTLGYCLSIISHCAQRWQLAFSCL